MAITSDYFQPEEGVQDGAPVVKFYLGRVYMDPVAREQAIEDGRITAEAPDYVETDFVRIAFPGNRLSIYDQPIKTRGTGMNPDDRSHPERFPREWAAYQNRIEGPQGTPLTVIAGLNAADINHLDKFDVLTVENLAGLSDIAVISIGHGIGRYRDMARGWIAAQPKAVVDPKAQAEISDLQAQLSEMRAAIAAMNAPKRGRPAKLEESDVIAE